MNFYLNLLNANLNPRFATVVLFLLLSTLLGLSADAQAVENQESEVVNKLPTNLPVRVEFSGADSTNLLKDLKIKITNTGDKPIYYVKIYIELPEEFEQAVFSMKYGNPKLITFTEVASEGDISLKKNESHTFAADSRAVENFTIVARKRFGSMPNKLYIKFQLLSFGDRTGFWGSTGKRFSFTAEEAEEAEKTEMEQGKKNAAVPGVFFLNQVKIVQATPLI